MKKYHIKLIIKKLNISLLNQKNKIRSINDFPLIHSILCLKILYVINFKIKLV